MPDSRPSFKELFREIPFWILLAVTIVFFYRPLFSGETFFFRDIYNHIYPQKKLFAELVLSGQLPLWDPYRHGGQPFLANMNNSVLYPSNLLYLIMPVVTALNIDIVLHVALSALAAYMLARILGVNSIAASATGVIYAFCGPSLSLPNIWPYAALHPPLILLFWHLYCLENKNRWFFITVVAGAIQIFAGHPEMTAFTFATLLIWTLVFPYKRKVISRLGALCILFIAILATAAIQLLPMIELVSTSGRSHAIRADVFFAWSVDPKRYPELLFPKFLGSVYSLLESDRWGMSLEELGTPYILSLYFGVSTLLLATLGGLNKISSNAFPRRVRMTLLILIIFSFVAMGGRHVPGFAKLIHQFPFVTIFRYPVKFIFMAILPIALLAGFQLKALMQVSETRILRLPIAISSFIATSLAILAFLMIFPSMFSHFLANYFSADGNAALKGLRYSILHATGFSILFTLCITLGSLRKRYRLDIVLSILIAFDLLVAGSAVNHYAPREFLTDIPDLPIYVKNQIGDGKLYRTADRFFPDSKISPDIVFSDRTRLETLSNYVASMYGIPVVFHEDYDWLENDRMSKLGQKLERLPWERKLQILSSAGVRFVLSSYPIQTRSLHLVRMITNPNNIQYFLYKNDSCAGQRAFFVSDSTIETDPNKLLNTLTNPNFDPCTMVLLEHSTVGSGIHGQAHASVKLNNAFSYSSSYVVVTDKPGFLVLTEPFTPGWKWIIDGWVVSAVRANFAFQAVAVPAGKHQIDRTYMPASLIIGSTISLISLLCLTIAVSKESVIVPAEIAEPSYSEPQN